jgi:hypothetical protein
MPAARDLRIGRWEAHDGRLGPNDPGLAGPMLSFIPASTHVK